MGSYYVALAAWDLLCKLQAGFNLTEISLLLPSKCWVLRCTPPHPACAHVLKISFTVFFSLHAYNFSLQVCLPLLAAVTG